ncbi:MAG: DUF4332 domain-containing protein [Caldilineales bacterium]|nr:DUF4332 domain-containing protein [Caldilineales bacterium]
MAKTNAIEGIGDAYAARLAEAGIKSTEGLLAKAATPADRKMLAEATGIDGSKILAWANRADLFRIKGVSTQYSDLLEAAGVDTVPELAQRNAANLHAKMAAVNAEKGLVRQLPSADMVASWVEQAKSLPRVMQY